ncbi:MAG TPA: hypothetical protein VKV77_09025 [Methylovirgula sp.]|nr:hypothetical protein [Methylovirgula sp.]
MRRTAILAFLALSALAAQAQAATRHHVYYGKRHGSYVGSLPIGHYAERYVYPKRGRGYAALVGDPDSGLGFYPLPYKYRVGAWRYRVRNTPPPWANPVIQAAQAQAVRSWWDIPTAADSYRYGVYNPIDGVGSPFFAGYYGPAGEGDPPFPFGRPYDNP